MNPNTISSCLNITPEGHLSIGGVDTVSLAEVYGTPLYVMDESTIRSSLRAFRDSLNANYKNGGTVAYASKACSFKEMYRIVKEEECSVDVVSGGELYTAVQAGFPTDRIYFHGNNKTDSELTMALSYNVGRIVTDNMQEIERLSSIAVAMNKTASIFMRITPGIDAHTHDFIKTGQIDSKFGFTFENNIAIDAVEKALSLPNIELKGFHCHIGSQIFDREPFEHAAEVMMNFMAEIRSRFGITLYELNLGGGFGVKYTAKDEPISYGDFMGPVAKALTNVANRLDYPVPFIIIEPGRSIVASAGITLYTVGNVKTIPGFRTYVSVDGGMTDNPRYSLYQAEYTALIANKADQQADMCVSIAGRCCETDLLQENTYIQSCDPGDTLAMLTTGAYNYSMASHYNRLPKPAVVMVNEGQSRVVVKGETYEDLLRNDV